MAASCSHSKPSSSIVRGWTYDVFLSFRGLDTRKHFVAHLYTALDMRGLFTFKDEQRLLTGEPISEQLSTAIEESRFVIVVFSENYADSAWCLDELLHIRDCSKQMGLTIIPVFYNVGPYVVRRQLKSYGEAFEKHEKRYEIEKIQMWKEALFEIAGLFGFDVSNTYNGYESECIQNIVQEISNICVPILNRESKLVGMDSRVQDVKSLLGIEPDVRFVGIWGIGGAGKTTLAWAVYNEISYQFEAKSFVENVRELSGKYDGLKLLQQKILSEILFDKNLLVRNSNEGLQLMRSRLRRKKVLLVLDDVDNYTQLDELAESHAWFGVGSRIIITTRDQHWLTRPTKIEMYNANLLCDSEAIILFSLYAFNKDSPPKEYKDDSVYLVRKSGGFPLTLKVLGASLYGSTMIEWKSTLSRLEVEGEDDIIKMIKVSYERLSEIDRKIFLDIACFFKGEKVDRVTRILDSFDFHAHIGIKHLIQRSLIYISNKTIQMHDRIQEMGWQIVLNSSDKPGERSRLWHPHNICHVLAKNLGTEAVEGISYTSRSSDLMNFEIDTKSFKELNKLRLLLLNDTNVEGWFLEIKLIIHSESQSSIELQWLSNLRWLVWNSYNLESLGDFLGTLKQLVGLEMPFSNIVKLWNMGGFPNGRKIMDKLRFINLDRARRLQQIPDLNLTPNLHTLILDGCLSLVELHPSIGDHGQLVFLSLADCCNLVRLPPSIEMKSLETFILSRCGELRRFPDIKGNMNRLSKLYLDCSSIGPLPSSIRNLSSLVEMNILGCFYLTSLPNTICELKCLKTLNASSCWNLEKLPENLGQLQSLEELFLNHSGITELPFSISLLKNLKTLSLTHCKNLMPSMLTMMYPYSSRFGLRQSLLQSFSSIKSLFLTSCNLSDGEMPADFSPLSSLEELYLGHNLFTFMPEGICHLPRLKILDVSYWRNCKEIEGYLPSGIVAVNADYTAKLTSFPDLFTKYDSLWKISSFNSDSPAEHPVSTILKFLLQGLLVANHRFSLTFRGCHIPEWFREHRPENHPYMQQQLPLNWFKQDILGFAISTVFDMSSYKEIDIQLDLIDESDWKFIPEASPSESQHLCLSHCAWLGFISFSFFQLLFPEYQLDYWSSITDTIRASCNLNGNYKNVAIRPVYPEDVGQFPTITKSLHCDPLGRPWLQASMTKKEPDEGTAGWIYNVFPGYHFSSTTAYLKDRGHRHASIVFNIN